jgi:hypothetical protein
MKIVRCKRQFITVVLIMGIRSMGMSYSGFKMDSQNNFFLSL